jgi:hypothetical protein
MAAATIRHLVEAAAVAEAEGAYVQHLLTHSAFISN